ncbi:uncharacterized protein J3R85_006052 [Psidium guajava]|nr:uncharacterized protein J3R85_006052 [Psidium guajava]
MAQLSSSPPVSSRRTPDITPSVPFSCRDGLRIWEFSSEDKFISFFPHKPQQGCNLFKGRILPNSFDPPTKQEEELRCFFFSLMDRACRR